MVEEHICNNPDTCWCWIPEFPKGLNNYEKAQLVLKKGVHRVDDQVVDMQSANAVKTIYDNLTWEKNKKKFMKIDFITLAFKCWDVIGKCSA